MHLYIPPKVNIKYKHLHQRIRYKYRSSIVGCTFLAGANPSSSLAITRYSTPSDVRLTLERSIFGFFGSFSPSCKSASNTWPSSI